MIDWTSCHAVERHEGIVSGAWVFRGTRLPVKSLFDNLEAGATVDEYVEWFGPVNKEDVLAVLEHAAESLSVDAAA